MEIVMLNEMTVPMLKELAKKEGLTGYSKLTKAALIERLEEHNKAKEAKKLVDDAPAETPVVISSPLSSDELWEEANKVAEEVYYKPKGLKMPFMNRHARRRAKAQLRKKLKAVH